MKYLLDTCVVSDFVKGEKNTLIRLKQTPPSHIAISSITLMEINYGLAINPDRAKKIEHVLNDFIHCVTVLAFAKEDANQAAKARAYLKSQGSPIGFYDVLIAGSAFHHGLVMVTANEKEFKRLPGLSVQNWRKSVT